MFAMRNEESITRGAILRTEMKALTEETVEMNRFREYYDGDQELVYSTDLFRDIFGDSFEGFKDNWMKVIVNAVRNRLKLINFHFDPPFDQPEDALDDVERQVWRVLKLNDIDVQQKDLHEGILVEGRAFVIVWPDETFGATVDWQPGQLCRVFYDPDRRTKRLWAVKRWSTETGDINVTFYTPGFVYKFIDRTKDLTASTQGSSPNALREIPGVGWFNDSMEERRIEGEEWPLPNPYGVVPVVEFNNTSYMSELKDHIPQQDALNKQLLDMLVTGEFQAFPQRIIETMSNEPVGGWQSGPGEIWHFKPSFDADGKQIASKFENFDTADPSTYMEPISMWLQHMALTSSTPVRYFMQSDRGGRGDSPSGESLLVDDKPLNDKVEEKQDRFGSPWMEVARLIAASLEIEDAMSIVGNAVWRDPRHDYRLSRLQEGKTMFESGIPVEFIATQIGLAPDDEALLLDLIAQAKAEQQAQSEAQNEAQMAQPALGSSPTTDPNS